MRASDDLRPHQAWIEWLLIAAVAALAIAPNLVSALTTEAEREAEIQTEWRLPGAFPELAWDLETLSAFPEKYERWLDDSFGFRTRLIRWHNIARLFWLGVDPNERVTVGPNGWLFIGSPQYLGYYRATEPFTEAELEVWREALEARRDWLAERGSAYVFMIAPSKSTIYPEEMPRRQNRVSETTRADQLYAYMREHSDVEMLDLRPSLLAAKQHELLYFEHGSHWNDRGAYVAYVDIMRALQAHFERLRPRPREDFEEVPAEGLGDTWVTKLHLGDRLVQESIELIAKRPVPLERGRYDDLTGNHFYIDTPNSWLPRMVMFRDSFGTDLVDLLAPHFSRSAFFWTREMDRDCVEREHPDVVLQELVERDLWIWAPTAEREPRE